MFLYPMKRWLAGVVLWLAASLSQAAPSENNSSGLPYRVLWHAYRLGLLASDEDKRMSLRSKNDVDPRTFVFTPKGAGGEPVMRCDENGLCTVRWDAEFYAQNQIIYSDQPKGSLDLSVGWNFTYNARLPVGINLILHGRTYAGGAYHSLMLRQAMTKR